MSSSVLRIILIEDHVLTRLGLKSALEDFDDIRVVAETGTATEGLNLLTHIPCDVAIVDIGLPDFDGIELLHRAHQQIKTSPPYFLVLTMHDQELEVLSAFASGADSYCLKDTDVELLTEAVRTTGEGHSWIDPAIASIVLEHVRSEKSVKVAGASGVTIRGLAPEQTQIIHSFPLTERELQVLELIVEGQSNSAIAELLHLSLGTIKTHIRNIFSKLSASDRTEAAVRALRSGLVD